MYSCKIMRILCFSIDTTERIDSIGRLVNDSPNNFANARIKRVAANSIVHLCLFAIKPIDLGTEIRYF